MIGKKNVKARKEYTCEACTDKINKGELHTLYSYRTPRYAECVNDPTEDGPQIGIDYWKVRTHLEETNCHLPENCRNGIHSFFTYDTGHEYVELCEDCGCSREDAIKPPVTFTDWNAECDLLTEYLNFRIDNSHRGQLRVLIGSSVLCGVTMSADEIFKLYQDQGFLINNSTPETIGNYQELTFEVWKNNFNKQTQYG